MTDIQVFVNIDRVVMRSILILVLFLSSLGIFSFIGINLVLADASPSASVQNSYILFWPLTAGKVEGDSLYSLKLFKEQIGSWFTFGDMKKADYAVELGTKRVLEAEKLLEMGKKNLALKALEKADSEFTSAYNHVKNKASKGSVPRDEIRRDRLINMKTLIDQLKLVAPEQAQSSLDSVKDKADSVLRDFLP